MSEAQIWQNAVFYTLSTIAQTLAAAFGILATFMLFRFQHAEGKIETHGENISESIATLDSAVATEELVERLKEGDAQAVEHAVKEVIDEVATKASRWKPAKRGGVERLRSAGVGISFWSAFHRRAMGWLRTSLLLTVVTIGMCIVLLPLVPLMISRMRLALTLTAVAVVLALICLSMYARLILLLLVPEAEEATPKPGKL